MQADRSPRTGLLHFTDVRASANVGFAPKPVVPKLSALARREQANLEPARVWGCHARTRSTCVLVASPLIGARNRNTRQEPTSPATARQIENINPRTSRRGRRARQRVNGEIRCDDLISPRRRCSFPKVSLVQWRLQARRHTRSVWPAAAPSQRDATTRPLSNAGLPRPASVIASRAPATPPAAMRAIAAPPGEFADRPPDHCEPGKQTARTGTASASDVATPCSRRTSPVDVTFQAIFAVHESTLGQGQSHPARPRAVDRADVVAKGSGQRALDPAPPYCEVCFRNTATSRAASCDALAPKRAVT